jgi:hypothetical protein
MWLRAALANTSPSAARFPSKTMREAILHLTGYRHRDVYDELYRRKREDSRSAPIVEHASSCARSAGCFGGEGGFQPGEHQPSRGMRAGAEGKAGVQPDAKLTLRPSLAIGDRN